MEMISSSQMKTLQIQLQQLEKQFHHIIKETNINENEDSLTDSIDELSSYDNHPADLGTELFEREKDRAIGIQMETDLSKVQQALQAIRDGSYGKCKVCGADIPYDRLQAVPYTLYCVQHTPDQHIATDRPVEEEILSPPINDSFSFIRNPYIRDSLDSFQEVARYGTSETPADFSGDHEEFGNLYDDENDLDGFTENIETFIATDITGTEVFIVPNELQELYEDQLDEAGMESQIGNIPLHDTDGYEEP